jgi:putative SOS response-associated peptidase YedK
LVPYWSKDDKTGFINARAERIDTAPAFRKRRCLIPADGFYEWKKTPEGKIPYSIEMKDGAPFVFAGLLDGWQNSNTKENAGTGSLHPVLSTFSFRKERIDK